MLETEQRIKAAWDALENIPHRGVVVYEHGQHWVICKCGASWSANDMKGTTDGFEFEEITSGKDDYHLLDETTETTETTETVETAETTEITRLTQELEIIRLKRAIAIEGPTVKGLMSATNLTELFTVIPIRKVITGLCWLLVYSWFFGFPLF